jgi:hypothetical protein
MLSFFAVWGPDKGCFFRFLPVLPIPVSPVCIFLSLVLFHSLFVRFYPRTTYFIILSTWSCLVPRFARLLSPLVPLLCLSSPPRLLPKISAAKVRPCAVCSYIRTRFFAHGLLAALMMVAVNISETSVKLCETTQRSTP